MAGASGSKYMAETFMEAAIEQRKQTTEEKIARKVFVVWEEMDELNTIRNATVSASIVPDYLVNWFRIQHYACKLQHLDLSLEEIFSEDAVFLLMLQVELKALKKISSSDEFAKTSYGEFTWWLFSWMIQVEKEIERVYAVLVQK